jgi:hypothetical protein
MYNFRNILSFHHRIMANFLRKRGWVAFYLDERSRQCNGECWLKLYQSSLTQSAKKHKQQKNVVMVRGVPTKHIGR